MWKINRIISIIRERQVKVAITVGIRFKIYLPAMKFYHLVLDWYHEIDTEGTVELSSLGIDENLGNRQESTPIRHISKIMQTLDITPEDVFIDMGSGKGRVILTAGRYPFKKIIGVDVSAELNKICVQNVEKMKNRLNCENYVNITSNVIDYGIPDDVTFVYFFNPFGLEAMNSVMHSIFKSVSRHPRKITIIWYNPKYSKELETTYSLKKKKVMNWNNFGLFDSRCVFYEIGNS